MKGLYITLIIFFLTWNLYSQGTKFVVRKSSDLKNTKELNKGITIGTNKDFIEEYYVLKNDENIRHGTYVKYRQTFFGVQVLESGSFQDGLQNGLWEYYYDIHSKGVKNSIKVKGYYANGKRNGLWMYFYRDTIPEIIKHEKFGDKKRIDSINISIDQQSAKLKLVGMYLNDKKVGEWTSFTYDGEIFQKYNFSKQQLVLDPSIKDTLEFNTNRRALFIGGLPCLIDFLTSEFNFTYDLISKMKNDSTAVVISFTIDKNGNAINLQVDKSQGNKQLEKEALRVIALTNNNWIAAISESKLTDSVYKIQFYIVKKNISQTQSGFRIGYKPIFE